MTAPAADCASEPGRTILQPRSAPGVPNINPNTGLSTDYLNHFTEAIMVLEMVSSMPECMDDLRAWHPKTYSEHFAASNFSERDSVIAAYEAAEPEVKAALDAEAEKLNAALSEAREFVLHYLPTPAGEITAQRMSAWLRALAGRMAAVINGTGSSDRRTPQATVDAIIRG
jgi:hypothetical protein